MGSREPEHEALTPAPPERERPAAAPSPANRILELQQSAGNAAVARAIRQWQGQAVIQREIPTGDEYQAARRAKDAFVAAGVRGPQDHAPSTGRGGFEVAYVPQVGHGALNVNLRGGVDFQPGIKLISFLGRNYAIAKSPAPAVAQAVSAINALPNDQRAAAAAPWQWGPGESDQFLLDFERVIRDAWHRQFTFRCTKQFWGDLGADVNVIVGVHAGPKTDNDHMSVTTYKVPENATVATTGNVGMAYPGASANTRDQRLVLNSSDVRQRGDIALTTQAGFDPGTDTLDANGQAAVSTFATTFQTGGTGPICGTCGAEIAEAAGTRINVHVQGSGADPQSSANTRFNTIVAALTAGGMSDAGTRAVFHYDGAGEGARLVVGGGATQVVAAHEAGHMFGLEDEYTAPFTSVSAGALGTPTDPGLGAAQGLPGAVRENSDSIMAVGNAVKPQHYAVFLEALKAVTAMPDWELGEPTGVVPPGVDGPLPQPPGQPGRPAEPASAVA